MFILLLENPEQHSIKVVGRLTFFLYTTGCKPSFHKKAVGQHSFHLFENRVSNKLGLKVVSIQYSEDDLLDLDPMFLYCIVVIFSFWLEFIIVETPLSPNISH